MSTTVAPEVGAILALIDERHETVRATIDGLTTQINSLIGQLYAASGESETLLSARSALTRSIDVPTPPYPFEEWH